jgi:hypothetical protein
MKKRTLPRSKTLRAFLNVINRCVCITGEENMIRKEPNFPSWTCVRVLRHFKR